MKKYLWLYYECGVEMNLLEKYTEEEFLAVEASRFIEDNSVGVVGIGLGQISALLAQKTHSPKAKLVYEAGQVAPTIKGHLPNGVDDTCIQSDAECHTDLLHTLGWLANAPSSHSKEKGKRADWCVVGAGQVDKHGNLNTTVIGDYYNPKFRLPGCGGSHDLLAGANEVFIATRHDKRSLVKELDYWTSPGYGMDGKLREEIHFPGKGPKAIITTKCTLEPNDENEFILKRVQPHCSIEEVKDETGWDLKVADEVERIEEPPEKYIEILREELDPERKIIGRPEGA